MKRIPNSFQVLTDLGLSFGVFGDVNGRYNPVLDLLYIDDNMIRRYARDWKTDRSTLLESVLQHEFGHAVYKSTTAFRKALTLNVFCAKFLRYFHLFPDRHKADPYFMKQLVLSHAIACKYLIGRTTNLLEVLEAYKLWYQIQILKKYTKIDQKIYESIIANRKVEKLLQTLISIYQLFENRVLCTQLVASSLYYAPMSEPRLHVVPVIPEIKRLNFELRFEKLVEAVLEIHQKQPAKEIELINKTKGDPKKPSKVFRAYDYFIELESCIAKRAGLNTESEIKIDDLSEEIYNIIKNPTADNAKLLKKRVDDPKPPTMTVVKIKDSLVISKIGAEGKRGSTYLSYFSHTSLIYQILSGGDLTCPLCDLHFCPMNRCVNEPAMSQARQVKMLFNSVEVPDLESKWREITRYGIPNESIRS